MQLDGIVYHEGIHYTTGFTYKNWEVYVDQEVELSIQVSNGVTNLENSFILKIVSGKAGETGPKKKKNISREVVK